MLVWVDICKESSKFHIGFPWAHNRDVLKQISKSKKEKKKETNEPYKYISIYVCISKGWDTYALSVCAAIDFSNFVNNAYLDIKK